MKDRRALQIRRKKGIKILRSHWGFKSLKYIELECDKEISHSSNNRLKRHIGLNGTTPCTCSNPFCCGNPRRQRGINNITIQELKAPTINDWND